LNAVRIDEDPNFDRDPMSLNEILGHKGSQSSIKNSSSPRRNTFTLNKSDSQDKSPRLFKQSAAKLYAQEKFAEQ